MSPPRKPFTFPRRATRPLFALAFLALCAAAPATAPAPAPNISITSLNKTGIYPIGAPVGWTLTVPPGSPAIAQKYPYVIKKNNQDAIQSGELDLSSGQASVQISVNDPAMLYLRITPPNNGHRIVAGAAVAPTQLQPVAPRPADFDSFWQSKIAALEKIPANPVLTPGDSGRGDVQYAIIKMDHVNGAHIYGQLAKPNRDGKFPALLIFQWAGGPYPLQKSWVTDHAAAGWLTLNIEPHDVLPDQPPAYYANLPTSIKNYSAIGNDDRDKSYFLQMYLADYRAVDYLAARPDWDGKTLVVMGASMGGQQSLCVAGLHPAITHVIVNEPAGCDMDAALHGRERGYPDFPSDNPKIMQTALYFDAVNFASRIKAPCLVAMGFVDTVAPPAGIWTAFNQIHAPKLAVPMISSPHGDTATAAQQLPYTDRANQWLDTLVKGGAVLTARPTPPGFARIPDDPIDHQDMMNQLGVRALRPGPDGSNPAIYNEATANPYTHTMPDVLTFKDGTKVTSPDQWPQRRSEIREDFAREIYGRIPPGLPPVTWKVTATTTAQSGNIPTITRTLIGNVDNSADPQITVDIQATFTVPAGAAHPVPIMLVFGSPNGFGFAFRPRPTTQPGSPAPPPGIPWTQQAITHGWGYGYINPGSIQPDNNHLTTGIIGLTNRGQRRKPDQWGALRAWQWGVSRLIDYFQTHPDMSVDPTKVGIEGVSRYGKAAIVTEAFDTRVAVGLIASSGEGGVKLHRHIFGESVESLAGGEYYWMAGNFIKYGASDPPRTAGDLPVDSHELIALCAPRPCFISYGNPAHGDPNWVDAHGSFMAAVLASPVYTLLGKQGLGTPGDYLTDPMPPIGQLIGGELAWRQHNGGHDVTPNWPSFFEWVSKYIQAPPLPTAEIPADQPSARTDPNSQLAHLRLLDKARQGGIDVYFLGDSITRRWGCGDAQYADLLANWKANFFGWNAADFGWGGDTTQNILWRLQNGELDGVNPKIIVLLAGTNNVGPHGADDAKIASIASGLKAIIDLCRQKAPRATIVLTAIFPRNDNMDAVPAINQINARLAQFADGQSIRYLNLNDKFADPDGKLFDGLMNPHDKLHLTAKGYQIWADALKPIFTQLLGPPASTDHAPPPTGDPNAGKPAASPAQTGAVQVR